MRHIKQIHQKILHGLCWSLSLSVYLLPWDSYGFEFKELDRTLSDNTFSGYKTISNEAGTFHFISPSPSLEKNIQGKVIDENDAPLPGVNVVVKGTTTGTVTDIQGNYRLTVSDEAAVLVFSSIGYTSQEIVIGSQSTINIEMAPDVKSLEEIIVIGYGTQQKKDLTGSVASVSSKDLEANTISTPDQALQGKVAGVNVRRNSFAPGGGISVQIRGTASLSAGGQPLYVIDGVPISTDLPTSGQNDPGTFGAPPNPMNSIDPSQIASIQVLKDASATAIYGSRAANGVVLITTKRGEAGLHNIDFETSLGVQKLSNKLDFLTAGQWAQQANERADLLGQNRVFTDAQVASFGEGTDWQNEVFRTAPSQRYKLSFSGGNEGLRYLIAGNYTGQDGIISGTNFKRYGATINMDADINKRLTINESLMFTATNNKVVPTDTKGYEGVSNVIDALYEAIPTIPARDSTGQPTSLANFPYGGGRENPLVMTEKYKQLGNTLRLLGNIAANYNILEGLDLNIRFGADINDFRWHAYYPIGSEGAAGAGGKASQSSIRNINWINANTLTYQKAINNVHRFTVLGGFTYQKEYTESLGAESWGFPGDVFSYNNLGLGTNPRTPSTSARQWQLISYLGRLNYSLLDKYLFTTSLRIDGSSKFGANNKYGYFPSVAFAWRVDQEPFIQQLDLFSQLKLRTSYGKTGNESIGVYQSISKIGTSFGTRSSYIFNGAAAPIAYPQNLANPDLSWEKTSEWNIGADMGFFDDRLTFSADYYHKTTTDLLLSVPVPSQTGFSSVLQNTGSMENKGVEFGLNSINMAGDFNWSTNLNISFNRNKILSLGGAPYLWTGWVGGGNVNPHAKNVARMEPGYAVGQFFGSVYDGIWQSQEEINEVGTMPAARPGDIRYKDVDGDGTYDTENDDIYLGDPNPDFSFGVTNDFSYQQLSLHVFMYGQYGNDILNLTTQQLALDGLGTSAKRMQRWTPENTNNPYPAASASNPQRISSLLIEDGSFLRIGNVTLSYNLPVQKWKIGNTFRNIQVGVAADNLAIITNYSGYDPEVNSYGNSNTTKGMDRFGYPPSRIYRLDVRLGF